MSLSYRQKLFLYFSFIFAFFTIGILVFEQSREKAYKTQALEEKLEVFTDIVSMRLANTRVDLVEEMETLRGTFPSDLRLTIIDGNGNVLYDNSIFEVSDMNNHISRPEIVSAENERKGSDIRISRTNNQEYLYFAKKSGNIYVRVALPYNIQLQQVLKADNAFIYFIIIFFIVFLFFIHVATNRFGSSISQLRDFVVSGDVDPKRLTFPRDELGEIGAKIIDNYYKLAESQKNIHLEKQKLLQHIQISEEGICFISTDHEVEFYNGLFIQYLNVLTDEPSSEARVILSDPLFSKLHVFLKQNIQDYFEDKIDKHGKSFTIRANVFEDGSYEIILNDITKEEKTKKLKREMTGNIAHELRTPITSIRGYLETVLSIEISEERRRYFIEQAYGQTVVLSDIIQDMSLIAKMEEAPDLFALEEVCISDLLQRIKEDTLPFLSKKNISFQWDIPDNKRLKGNFNLLYSLFRNLIDNTIRYAGENISIQVNLYNEDAGYYYFSYYDTGIGLEGNIHMNRLFERFYRITEGRTRDDGGTGLGLSIVKNAVLFHKGTISVKNRSKGGLEFLFTLQKS